MCEKEKPGAKDTDAQDAAKPVHPLWLQRYARAFTPSAGEPQNPRIYSYERERGDRIHLAFEWHHRSIILEAFRRKNEALHDLWHERIV